MKTCTCFILNVSAILMLQVFHAKLLHELDESGPNIDAFKELCTATDLALHATKAIAQTIGRAMASLA